MFILFVDRVHQSVPNNKSSNISVPSGRFCVLVLLLFRKQRRSNLSTELDFSAKLDFFLQFSPDSTPPPPVPPHVLAANSRTACRATPLPACVLLESKPATRIEGGAADRNVLPVSPCRRLCAPTNAVRRPAGRGTAPTRIWTRRLRVRRRGRWKQG